MSSSRSTMPHEGVADNNKIIFLALGALFGLAVLTFVVHMICVKCLFGRTSITLGDESEEISSGTDMRERRRRRRIRRRRHHLQFEEHDDSSSVSRHVHLGLDKSVVELLPVFVFNPEVPFRDVVDCSVCLAEFVDGERGRFLPKCRHCFHVECIDMWFLSHSSCPLCRCEVSLSPLSVGSDPDHDDEDPELPRSLSCPRFYGYRTQEQTTPLSFGPLDLIGTRFSDIDLRDLEEECFAGPSSLPSAIASQESSTAIPIPEHSSNDNVAENSNSNHNDDLEIDSNSGLPAPRRDAALASSVVIEISDHDESWSIAEDEQHELDNQRATTSNCIINQAAKCDSGHPIYC